MAIDDDLIVGGEYYMGGMELRNVAVISTNDLPTIALVRKCLPDVDVIVYPPEKMGYHDPTLEFGKIISVGHEAVRSRVEDYAQFRGIVLPTKIQY